MSDAPNMIADEEGPNREQRVLGLEALASISRQALLETESRTVASPPQPRTALEYTERAYRVGLFDGSHWVAGEGGERICEQAAEIEKQLRYPFKLAERLIAKRSELCLVSNRLSNAEEDLRLIEGQATHAEATYREAQEQRDGFLVEVSRSRIAVIQAAIDKAGKEGESRTPERQVVPPAPAPLTQVFTGIGFLIAWITLLFADLALSIGAIYALGFPDPIGGGTWDSVVTNFRRWTTEWVGLSVCFGITATTFFFKLLYEKIKHRKRDGLDNVVFYFLLGICGLAVVSLGAFAILRVEYLATQMAVQVSPFWAKVATVTGSILFLVASAVCLSEGLQTLSVGVWRMWPWKAQSAHEREAEELALWQLPSELRTLLETAERERKELRTALERARKAVEQDRALKVELEEEIALVEARLIDTRQASLDYPAIDRELYRLGREHGARARRSEGAFRIIEDLLGADIAGSST